MRILLLCSFIFPLSACDPAPVPEPTPATEKPRSDAFELDAYCDAMCARTAECSIEVAAAAAALGGDATEEALRNTRAELSGLRESCAEGCRAEPVDPLDKRLALHAKRCLDEADCASMERCLAGL